MTEAQMIHEAWKAWDKEPVRPNTPYRSTPVPRYVPEHGWFEWDNGRVTVDLKGFVEAA